MSEETVKLRPGWKSLAAWLALTLGAGGAVGMLLSGSTAFYDALPKPAFAPPAWVFPVVWTALYAAMAVSIWLITRTGNSARLRLCVLYVVQLLVNLVWPVLFFIQHALGLAFLWLVLLAALILLLMIPAFRLSRAAGWLLTPYLAWTIFAGILNFLIAQ